MKWSIQQLQKLKKPFKFDFELDLSSLLGSLSDVNRLGECKVSGICREIHDDTYEFAFDINATLFLECSVTLEEIPYSLSSSVIETFGYNQEYSLDINLIEKNTIDLTDVVLTEIIVSKPMKIVKEGYEEYFSEEPESKINPAFAGLKDLIGGDNK